MMIKFCNKYKYCITILIFVIIISFYLFLGNEVEDNIIPTNKDIFEK